MPIQPLKICFCAFLQPDFMKRWGRLSPAWVDFSPDHGSGCS
jgi:hypothetical protein